MLQKLRQKALFWQNPVESDQELVLNRKRIYIIPNKQGVVYAVLLIVIFIASINYTLNLGFALDFILISCGWLGINLTHRNLSGIGLLATSGTPVFQGELAHFNIHLSNSARFNRYAIHIGFSKESMQVVDVASNSTHNLLLATSTKRRGWVECPKVRIETTFPYGLLTAWSYWKFSQKILVFPRPEMNPPPLPFIEGGRSGNLKRIGNEEFSGIRNYQPGDPLKQIAWRHMARQYATGVDTLLSKNFEGGQENVCVIDFDNIPELISTEQKLSRMCAWVLTAEREQVNYAFKLKTLDLAKGCGDEHRMKCLTALALCE